MAEACTPRKSLVHSWPLLLYFHAASRSVSVHNLLSASRNRLQKKKTPAIKKCIRSMFSRRRVVHVGDTMAVGSTQMLACRISIVAVACTRSSRILLILSRSKEFISTTTLIPNKLFYFTRQHVVSLPAL